MEFTVEPILESKNMDEDYEREKIKLSFNNKKTDILNKSSEDKNIDPSIHTNKSIFDLLYDNRVIILIVIIIILIIIFIYYKFSLGDSKKNIDGEEKLFNKNIKTQNDPAQSNEVKETAENKQSKTVKPTEEKGRWREYKTLPDDLGADKNKNKDDVKKIEAKLKELRNKKNTQTENNNKTIFDISDLQKNINDENQTNQTCSENQACGENQTHDDNQSHDDNQTPDEENNSGVDNKNDIYTNLNNIIDE